MWCVSSGFIPAFDPTVKLREMSASVEHRAESKDKTGKIIKLKIYRKGAWYVFKITKSA